MEDKHTLYYKEVEACFRRFKECYANLLPVVKWFEEWDDAGIMDWLHCDSFPWSEFSSIPKNELLNGELTEEQKEEIALSHKTELDDLIIFFSELCEQGYSLVAQLDNVRKFCKSIIQILKNSISTNLIYDYSNAIKEEIDESPFILTAEELYWALVILGDEKARLVLSGQGQILFDTLYNSYQKGKEDFIHTFRQSDASPIIGLRGALCSSIKDIDSLYDFIEMQLLEDRNLFAVVGEEILNSESSVYNIMCCQGVTDINLDEINKNSEKLLINFYAWIESREDLARFEKKQIHNLKRPISFDLQSKQMDGTQSTFFSSKALNTVVSLMDKWLILKIHERAQINKGEISYIELGENKPKRSLTFQKGGRSSRLDFPTRLTAESQMSPSPVSAQEQKPILREIYNLYGGSFENMSCEDFLYLFGAAFVKQPSSYHPPYYWMGPEATMKALLRILYIKQPRILKDLILHTSDKNMGVISHDWGRNKSKVAYQDIEETIISIIDKNTGKSLKPL